LRTGAQHVATAHNADDQVETVLMRLLRGAGPDSLGGIGEVSPDGVVVRPLLGVSRSEILDYARENGLRWREDASNDDPAYTRSRIRRELVPGLTADFNPQLLRAIGDLAEAQRRETEWVESLVEEEAGRTFDRSNPEALGVDAAGWNDRPEALARRLVKRGVIEMGGGRDLSRAHLIRALEFLRHGRAGTEIQLPGGLRLRRASETSFRLFRDRSERG
jgi:tRNA(Ile)-lysidine synthase TilS/MesJ